ncbi:MAG: hypothetical protein LUQ64_04905, partial [Methanomicrobiales archaeon]|nr:hypothetical protein [Methanomicrobiales archaeon]
NGIPQEKLDAQDRKILQASLVGCSVLEKMCVMLEGPFADFIDHSQNFSVSRDPAYEARMMLSSLEEMGSEIDVMDQEIQTIDESDIPPEIRGDFVSMKVAIQSLGTEVDEAIQTLRSTCLKSCGSGEVLGSDCLCHPRCGTGTTYCADSDAICCLGTCYVPCPKGYTMDSTCHCTR